MSTQVCQLCAEILAADQRELGICLLCRHRTNPRERTTTALITGLIDGA